MKKITFLFTLLLTSSMMLGQVVLSEDFNAGLTLPTGWTNDDIAGNGEVWTFATGSEAPNFTAGNTMLGDIGFTANYAILNSDVYGNNGTAENAALTSPVFDATAFTSLELKFDHLILGDYGGEGHVEVYNGTTWIEVAVYSEATIAPNTNGNYLADGVVLIDVSTELAGVSNAQVRFRWVGNWGFFWAVDNISVFQCTIDAPDAVTLVSPANAATDVAIAYGTATTNNSVGPFEWTGATTGSATDSYSISLGLTATGDDIGTLGGFSSGGTVSAAQLLPNTTYYWYITSNNCGGSTASAIYSFTTAACTATAVPIAIATAPIPANVATVSLAGPDSSITLNWTGDINADETYTLNIGTSPLNMQAFSDFQNGTNLTGLAVSTQYFWRIDVVNCIGITEGTQWSFTTDAELSTGNFTQENVFTHFLNQNTNVLTVTSANAAFDNITMYDILGKQVINKTASQTRETVNMSNLEDGIYILQVTIGGKTQTVKLLKQ
ncbi:T9SS type A sorting domain-containing protein [Lacinutrix undariae]